MKAILLISHGSRSQKSTEENAELAQILKEKSGFSVVEYAFLDVASPDIPEGIRNCVKQGVTEIIVLQNFLNSGNHVLKDIPEILEQARTDYPQLVIHVRPPIGAHSKLPELFLDLISQ